MRWYMGFVLTCVSLGACGSSESAGTEVQGCEVEQTDAGAKFVCPDGTTAVLENGRDGVNAQGRVVIATSVTAIPDSGACPGGGVSWTAGPDEDEDGTPDAATAKTQEICGGVRGADARRAEITAREVPVGEECASGGSAVDLAFDQDGDDEVGPEEVERSLLFCKVDCGEGAYFDEVLDRCRSGYVMTMTGMVLENTFFVGRPEEGLPEVGRSVALRIAYPATQEEVASAPMLLAIDLKPGRLSRRGRSSVSFASDENMLRDVYEWSWVGGWQESDGVPTGNLDNVVQSLSFEATYKSVFPMEDALRVLRPLEHGAFTVIRFRLALENGLSLLQWDPSTVKASDFFPAFDNEVRP